mgnify:CR=1 FL=1
MRIRWLDKKPHCRTIAHISETGRHTFTMADVKTGDIFEPSDAELAGLVGKAYEIVGESLRSDEPPVAVEAVSSEPEPPAYASERARRR